MNLKIKTYLTKMESKNDSVQNLFFSFFKQSEESEEPKEKELDAVILIQRWWRNNQWKRFYTIPKLDTDVISTECNIGDHYQFYLKRKFDETELDETELDETEDTNDTSDISDAKSDYDDEEEEHEEQEEQEHEEQENLVVDHNNFINDFFNSFFAFLYKGIKFMFGF